MDRTGAAPPDAALLIYARAVAARDRPAAQAALVRIDAGPFTILSPILAAWQAYDGGGDALARLGADKTDSVARRYIAENRALLLIATSRFKEGATALEALLGDAPDGDVLYGAAQLLAAKGKPELGQALLGGDDPTIVAMRQSLGSGVKPSSAFGASRLFTRLAADLAQGDPTPLTISLTRAALRLDPGNDRARILLAQSLARTKVAGRALAALDEIGAASPFHELALQVRVEVLNGAGQADDALATAQPLAARAGATSADAARLGDLLVATGRFDEAVKAYGLAIERAGSAPPWTLYLQLGSALDQAGRWPAARAALQQAVALAPQAAAALNYLGYARIEHGEDIAGSVTMLERANALQPDQLSITDSLAWAYFRAGDATRALPLLERAAQGEPANATINEHLGDAYWSLGRRYEARYAWRAAAVVADAAESRRLADKIANGVRAQP